MTRGSHTSHRSVPETDPTAVPLFDDDFVSTYEGLGEQMTPEQVETTLRGMSQLALENGGIQRPHPQPDTEKRYSAWDDLGGQALSDEDYQSLRRERLEDVLVTRENWQTDLNRFVEQFGGLNLTRAVIAKLPTDEKHHLGLELYELREHIEKTMRDIGGETPQGLANLQERYGHTVTDDQFKDYLAKLNLIHNDIESFRPDFNELAFPVDADTRRTRLHDVSMKRRMYGWATLILNDDRPYVRYRHKQDHWQKTR